MLKKSSKLIICAMMVLVSLSPSISLAQGKIFSIKKGQKAPFAGTLFDVTASANLTVKMESHETQCKIRITREKELCKNKSMFDLNLKIAELSALQTRHTDILEIKNNQIRFLQKKALQDVPWYENNKLWFAVGVTAGFAISFGSAYAWGQVAK